MRGAALPIRKLHHVETPSDRAIADRIKRAKAVKSPVDRSSDYHERLGELSRKLDLPIDCLIEEWSERAACREYLGGVSRSEAEELAFADVQERYGND